MNEPSKYKVSHFFTTKDGMVKPACELLNKWKQEGKPVKCIMMDNAGENKLLAKKLKSMDWKLNLTIAFPARDTP